MSNSPISASEIETHLECPKKWKYEHQLSVETAAEKESYERRGKLLRDIIFAVCEAEPATQAEAIDIATSELDDRWEAAVIESLYLANRQQAFDKAATRGALKSYLRGSGFDHIQNVVGRDTTTVVRPVTDETITISLDLITEAENGLLVVEILPNLNGISYTPQGNDDASDHINQSSYGGNYLGSVLRAELAIEAVDDFYGDENEDLQVEYLAVGLAESVSTSGPMDADDDLAVETEYRNLTDWHLNYSESNQELIANIVDRITAEDSEIPEPFVDDIRSNACKYCNYRKMCQSYLNWEVEF